MKNLFKKLFVLLFFLQNISITAMHSKYDEEMFDAAYQGDLNRLDGILKIHKNINARNLNGYTVLMMSVCINKLGTVKMLLEEGADIELKNKDGFTALYMAVNLGHFDIAKVLIKANANLEAKSLNGNTPLCEAIANKNEELAVLLLDSGANPNAAELETGINCLMIAIISGFSSIVDKLLEKGADVNSITKEGTMAACSGATALMLAATTGNLPVVRKLINQDADINAQESGGCTALMISIFSDNNEVAKYLLDRKADIYIKNNLNMNALSCAIGKENKEIEQYIITIISKSLEVLPNSFSKKEKTSRREEKQFKKFLIKNDLLSTWDKTDLSEVERLNISMQYILEEKKSKQ